MEIRKLPGVFTHLAFLLLNVSLTTQASAQARSFLLIDGRTLNITSYQGGNIQGSVTPISVTIPIRPIHPVLTEWLQHALAGDMKPRSLEIVLLDRQDLPSAGAGETPIVGIAPAVGNAIFEATGQRLRSLPLVPNGLPTSYA